VLYGLSQKKQMVSSVNTSGWLYVTGQLSVAHISTILDRR